MGNHTMRARVSGDTVRAACQVPRAFPGALPREDSPLLPFLRSVHVDRMMFLCALQTELKGATDLEATIAEENGFPFLSITRKDGMRSLSVGCVYRNGAWWFGTADIPTFARADNAHGAAAAIQQALWEWR